MPTWPTIERVSPAARTSTQALWQTESSRTQIDQWLPAMEQVAQRKHWRLVIFAKHGCPLADALVIKPGTSSQPYDECTTWRQDALKHIAALRPASSASW